jgi:hypothetical protein
MLATVFSAVELSWYSTGLGHLYCAGSMRFFETLGGACGAGRRSDIEGHSIARETLE